MNKKDYIDLEDRINDALNRTFNSMNNAGINNDFIGRAENAYYDAKDSIKKGTKIFKDIYKDVSKHSNNSYKEKRKEERREERKERKQERKIEKKNVTEVQYINKKPVGRVKGILYIVFGAILSVVFGIITAAVSIVGALSDRLSAFGSVGTIIFGCLFGGSVIMTLRGISLRKRIKRFKDYVKCLNGNTYCTIKEIAEQTALKEKFIVKDINKMINDRMFLQGHIDDNKSYIMISDEVYDDYVKSQESLKQREKEEEQRKKREAEEDALNPQNKEIRKIIDEGNKYIEQIKEANDAIPGEEISNKLYKLENIVKQIFKFIKKYPNKITDVSKFLNHYLPISLKLVQSYRELNDQPVQGENIINAKNEIEDTLDMINSAFEKLFDDLFQDVAMDISTDISVLHTLFNQEGLTDSDFDKKSK